MKRVAIQVDTGNVLRYLGSMYRSPRHALKEYVSNFLDSYLENRDKVEVCEVHIQLTEGSITIYGNPPGMDRKEFEQVLKSVARSVKQQKEIPQIGRLGIGIWAFHQFARRATFLSRKEKEMIKVILKEGQDQAEVYPPTKKEERTFDGPGMWIRFTGLKTRPTSKNSPLAPSKIIKTFSQIFDSYLRKGILEITLRCKGQDYKVEPQEITLPRIAADYSIQYINGNSSKKVELFLWFEPSGNGKVAIRHTGATIVEDITGLEYGYGLEESVFACGYVAGYIDADFLTPLPARNAFEPNKEWNQFLLILDRIASSVEAEVELLKGEMEADKEKRLLEQAKELAIKGIKECGLELELPRSPRTRREPQPPRRPPTKPPRKPPGTTRPRSDQVKKEEFRFAILPQPLPATPHRHSVYDKATGIIRINTINPDYQEATKRGEKEKLHYYTTIIQKEILTFNDPRTDDILEEKLTLEFWLRYKK